MLRLAWRNLWRNRRRTWLTASAIAFITFLLVFLITLQLGAYDLMVESSLRILAGHVQVQREAYLDKPQIRLVIPDARAFGAELRADPAFADTGIAVRAQGFALASSRTRSQGAQVIGVEPSHEPAVSTIPNLVKAGRYLASISAQEAVVATSLAKTLQIEVGDELTLLGSAMDGSIAATILPVVGLFESGVRDLDRLLIEIPLGTFQEVFGTGTGAHLIALRAPEIGRTAELRDALARRLPPESGLVARDWEQIIPGLRQIIQADWTTAWFTYIALIAVVTFSILNTFLMSVLERTHEFGIMLALGATPRRIGALVLIETALLAGLGLAIGIGLGFTLAN
jgi:ABC-type lipoprotein release transport system permease subunit